ncbi:MAG: PBSX family phage terminase large subunit [Raoultibacter sp.]
MGVKGEQYSEIWLEGGRGSLKSSFTSIEIVQGIVRNKDANAIVYRKVADTLRMSVYAQIVWAIEILGLNGWFDCRISPMEIVYRPTGQRIVFKGADRAEKSKGVKLARGYFKYLWFEELTEFDNMESIRTIKASVLRGSAGNRTITFYSYNPPMSARNWVNEEALHAVEYRLAHHSNYLSVPAEWLGSDFLRDAQALKDINERAYRHMYLGEVTGTGGQIFENLKIRSIAPAEWQGLPSYSGQDFGFARDPDFYIRCAYDRKRRTLFLVDEFSATGLLIDVLAEEIRKRCGRDVITCDSADPRSIAGLRAKKLRVTGAKKGPDSVNHGIKWLQTLVSIVVDPVKCPCAAKEFSVYEYDRDRAGEIIDRYPDHDNHAIDAVRYAVESVSTQKTAIVPQ